MSREKTKLVALRVPESLIAQVLRAMENGIATRCDRKKATFSAWVICALREKIGKLLRDKRFKARQRQRKKLAARACAFTDSRESPQAQEEDGHAAP